MKKIISLLMVTILLIACISGCASENNNSQVPEKVTRNKVRNRNRRMEVSRLY